MHLLWWERMKMAEYNGPERRKGKEFVFDNTNPRHESDLFNTTGFAYYSEPDTKGRYFVPRQDNLPADKLSVECKLEPYYPGASSHIMHGGIKVGALPYRYEYSTFSRE